MQWRRRGESGTAERCRLERTGFTTGSDGHAAPVVRPRRPRLRRRVARRHGPGPCDLPGARRRRSLFRHGIRRAGEDDPSHRSSRPRRRRPRLLRSGPVSRRLGVAADRASVRRASPNRSPSNPPRRRRVAIVPAARHGQPSARTSDPVILAERVVIPPGGITRSGESERFTPAGSRRVPISFVRGAFRPLVAESASRPIASGSPARTVGLRLGRRRWLGSRASFLPMRKCRASPRLDGGQGGDAALWQCPPRKGT